MMKCLFYLKRIDKTSIINFLIEKETLVSILFILSIHLSYTQNKASESNNLAFQEITKDEHEFERYFKDLKLVHTFNESAAYGFYTHYNWLFKRKGVFKECLRTGKKALVFAEKFEDPFNLTSITEHVSQAFISEGKIDSALFYNRKMLKFYETRFDQKYLNPKNNDYLFEESMLSGYNNIGIFFSEVLKKKDSAMYYFDKARNLPQIPESDNFQFLRHSINDNVALIYMEQGRYQMAKELYQKNHVFYKNKDKERWIRSSLQWGKSEIELGFYKKAEKRLLSSRKRMDSLGEYGSKLHNEILFSRTMESLYLKIKDFRKAEKYSDITYKLISEQNLIDKQFLKSQVNAFNEVNIQSILKLLDNEKVLREKEGNIKQLYFWLLVSTILVSIVILYLLFSRNKFKIQKVNAEKLVEKEKAKTATIKNKLLQREVDFKRKDLTLFANTIAENQKWGSYLLSKIKSSKKYDEASYKELIADLEIEIKDRIKIEQSNLNFQNRIDILNSEFYENLLKAHPNLTKTELKLCSLIRLNLDNKDIAIMQNISKDSVYRSRTRLRKKLNIPSNVDLNIFLKSF